MKKQPMKQMIVIVLTCLCFTQQMLGQNILFNSSFGGLNGNGGLVNYNLSNSTISMPISLGDNPLGISQDWIEGGGTYYGQYDDESKESGLFAGSDGYVYGIDTRAGNLTGAHDQGTAILYRFHPDSLNIEVLHRFTGNENVISNGTNGAYNNSFSKPRFGLIEGATGVLYGICIEGGANNIGGVWKFNMTTKKYSEIDSYNKNTIGYNVCTPLFKGLGNDLFGIMRTRSGGQDDGDLYKIDIANDTLVFYHDLSPGSGLLLTEPRGKVTYDAVHKWIIGSRYTDVSPFSGGGIFIFDFNTNTSYNVSQIWNNTSVLGSYMGGMVRGNDGYCYSVTEAGAGLGKGALIKSNPSIANCPMIAINDFKRNPNCNSLMAVGSKIIGTYDWMGITNLSDKSFWSYDVLTNTMVDLFPESNLTTGSHFLPQMAVSGSKVYIRYIGGGDNYEGGIMVLDASTLSFTNLITTHSNIGKTPIGELLDIGNNQFLGFTLSGGNFLNPYKNQSGTIVKYDLSNNSVTKVTDIKSIQNAISFTGYTSFDGSPAALKQTGMVKASNNKIYFTYKTFQTQSPGSLYYSELQTNVRFCELDLANNQMQELKLTPFSESTQPLEYTNGKMLLSSFDSVVVYNINTHLVEGMYRTHNYATYGYMNGKLTKGSNGKIYGLTVKDMDSTGSVATLFSLNPNNNFSFTAIHQFDSINFEPNINLTEFNGKLYGSTNSGGTYHNGYLFSLDTATNQFAIVHHFNSKTEGANFAAGWAVGNNKLYSTSSAGGLNGFGTLVEFNPSNNGLTVLSNLTNRNGMPLYGTPVFLPNPVGVKEWSLSEHYTLYPNPTAQSFSISGQQAYDRIEIYNVNGQLVYSSDYKASYTISGVNNGFYFVKIIKGDASKIEKLIIQK